MKLNQIIFILSVCLLLASCGFHLRGQSSAKTYKSLEGANVYLVVANDDRLLARQLKADLHYSKINIVEDATAASYHLIILRTDLQKRTVGVDSNGRDNEYEVSYQVDFMINQNTKNDLFNDDNKNIENKQVWSRRSFYLDVNDPIGKRSEEKQLFESMRGEVSKKLLSYLAIAMSNHRKINAILPDTQSMMTSNIQSNVQPVMPLTMPK